VSPYIQQNIRYIWFGLPCTSWYSVLAVLVCLVLVHTYPLVFYCQMNLVLLVSTFHFDVVSPILFGSPGLEKTKFYCWNLNRSFRASVLHDAMVFNIPYTPLLNLTPHSLTRVLFITKIEKAEMAFLVIKLNFCEKKSLFGVWGENTLYWENWLKNQPHCLKLTTEA